MNVSETPEAVFPGATKNRFRAQRILGLWSWKDPATQPHSWRGLRGPDLGPVPPRPPAASSTPRPPAAPRGPQQHPEAPS
ncbi:unnamed protein product [Arctogadus glacialis]